MTEHEQITILGQVPSKSNSYRIAQLGGHSTLIRSSTLIRYATSFYMQMGHYRKLAIQGLFELYVDVYFTTMSHDLDNSLKVILDCLQTGGAIKNDNRCVKIVAQKFIDRRNPRVELRVVEL